MSLRPDKGAVTSARLGQTALSVPLPSVQTGQRDGTVRMRFCRTSGSGPVTQSPGVSRAELGSRTRSGGKWQPRAGAEECGTLGAPGRAAPAGRRLALRGAPRAGGCLAFTAEMRGEGGRGRPADPLSRGVWGAFVGLRGLLMSCARCPPERGANMVLGRGRSGAGDSVGASCDIATPSVCESCRLPAPCVCPLVRACPAPRAAGSAGRRLS